MIESHSTATQRFFDWLFIRFSRNRRIDGLWVGIFMEDRGEEILKRVGEALLLIKTYDPYRYKRVLSEIERVWIDLLPGDQAVWIHALRRCVIDARFALSAAPESIASTIVHEATHGKLMRHGIGYAEEVRRRVEEVCMRQQLAFASKIPGANELRKEMELRLSYAPDMWTDQAFAERRRVGEAEMLRHLGTPDWLMKAVLRRREKVLQRQRSQSDGRSRATPSALG